jgi:hypothetical protein
MALAEEVIEHPAEGGEIGADDRIPVGAGSFTIVDLLRESKIVDIDSPVANRAPLVSSHL